MKIAKVDISIRYLEDVLKTQESPFLMRITDGLPKDASILWIEVKEQPYILRLYIKSDEFKDTVDVEKIPFIKPTFHQIR